MTESTIQLHFVMEGNFDPNDISSRLQIKPTKTARKGDVIHKKMLFKNDIWKLSSEEINTIDPYDLLRPMASILSGVKDELIKISADYDLKFRLSFFILLSNNESPILLFDKETIDFFSSIGISLDIDINY